MNAELPIISCESCIAACCREMNSPPFLGKMDVQLPTLPQEIQDSYWAGMDLREAAGWPDGVPCFWLDQETNQCKHYEHRPDICRDALEVGDEGCVSWRKHFKVKS